MISCDKRDTGGSVSWSTYLGAYVVLVSVTIAVFLALSAYGERTFPSAAPAPGAWAASAGGSDVLIHVLLALTVIVLACRAAGSLVVRIGQPAVIGEMLGGIVLGPTVLGHVAPDAMRLLFAPESVPFIAVIAQLGVMLYMFVVGLDLDTAVLGRRLHTALATSHASIAAPFTLGAIAALYLYPSMSAPGVSFTVFALFVGIAMSITAFPVVARILDSRGLSRQELGMVTLACAAGDDITAWCLLAVLFGVGSATVGSIAAVLLSTVAFVAVMALMLQPVVRRWAASRNPRRANALGGVLIAVLMSALVTETIGIHAIFGAFLAGSIIPHDSRVAIALRRDISGVVTTLMLPPFFALTGMRTNIDFGGGAGYWLTCVVLVLVATVGKVGGAMLSARLTGMTWRYAAGLGVLMNTRGLMELIVLNIGLDRGLITPTFFSVMVLVAVVTTVMTVPGLSLLKLGAATRAEEAAEPNWSEAEALASAVGDSPM